MKNKISLLTLFSLLSLTGCKAELKCDDTPEGKQQCCLVKDGVPSGCYDVVAVGPSASPSPSPLSIPSPLPTLTVEPVPSLSPIPVPSATLSPSPQPTVSVTPTPTTTTPPVAGYDDPWCKGITTGGWTLDKDGWVSLPLPAGARDIRVTANPGQLEISDPPRGVYFVKTLPEGIALLRKGTGDQLKLKRGETFPTFGATNLGGKSISEPMLIGAYGSGPRPLIKASLRFEDKPVSNLVVSGLHFQGTNAPGSYGFWWAKTFTEEVPLSKNVLFENTVFQNFEVGASIQSRPKSFYENITFYRSQFLDNWGAPRSQGAYLESLRGIRLIETLFDHNGYRNKTDAYPLGGTDQAHDVYSMATNRCFTAQGNIFSRGAGSGLQARAGGVVEDNFFVRNSNSLSYGLVNGGSITMKLIPPGVGGRVQRNAFYELTDINGNAGNARGMGIDVGNVRSALIADNLMLGYKQLGSLNQSRGFAISARMGIGVHNLTVKDLTIIGLKTEQAREGAGTGRVTLLSNASVVDASNRSKVLIPANGPLISKDDKGQPLAPGYYCKANGDDKNCTGIQEPVAEQTFDDKGISYSAYYQATLDPSKFVDGTRTLAKYVGDDKLSSDAAFDAFIAKARAQDRANWDSKFTGAAVSQYFRDGFKRKQ